MKARGLAVLLAICATIGYLVWRANRPDGRVNNVTPVKSSGATVRLVEGAAIDAPKPKRRYKIGVLFPFLAAPFWVNEAYGILDQGNKLGVDIVWLSADGYDNVDKQNSQMEDLVTRRVDAVLLAATSYTGTAPAVDRATAAGVPVFAHVTSSSSGKIVAAVLDEDIQIGSRQAEFMGTVLGNKGSVAMLNGPAAAEWSLRRVQGFKEVMKTKFPGIRIVAERFGSPDRADGLRLTEDLLTAFPDLNGVFSVADGIAMGAADAISSAKRPHQITVTTASFSRETIPFIKAGRIGINVDENPVLIGRTIVNTAVKALNGEAVPKLIYVPNPGITKENVDSVNPSAQWAPDGWRIH